MQTVRWKQLMGLILVSCSLFWPETMWAEQPQNLPAQAVYAGEVSESRGTVNILIAFQGLRDLGKLPNIPDGLVVMRALAENLKTHPKARRFHMEWSIRSGPLQLYYGVLYNKDRHAMAFRADGVWSIEGPSITDYIRFTNVTDARIQAVAREEQLSTPPVEVRTGSGVGAFVEDMNFLPGFNELTRQGCRRRKLRFYR